MKRFLSLAIITLLLIGCKGSTDEISEFKTKGRAMILTKGSRWVKDLSWIKYLSRVYRAEETNIHSRDRYYFVVDKDTRVLVINDSESGKYPRILFEEGKYRDKTGLTSVEDLKIPTK